MPLIKMINGTFTLQTGKINRGDVLEVDDETARRWEQLGLAGPVDDDKAVKQHRDEQKQARDASQQQVDEARAALEAERAAAAATAEHLSSVELDNPAARLDPNQANAAVAESRARRGRE